MDTLLFTYGKFDSPHDYKIYDKKNSSYVGTELFGIPPKYLSGFDNEFIKKLQRAQFLYQTFPLYTYEKNQKGMMVKKRLDLKYYLFI